MAATSSKKVVTVVGSTGNQGGSVARSLLKDGSFAVRAVTRNPDSDAAKALADLGAEIVKADASNKNEMEAAFHASWGAFVNTLSTPPSAGPDEYTLGKIIIDAAAAARVPNLVYSSGADTQSLTDGKVSCSMMMDKHKTLEYAKGCAEFTNVISVDAGWYLQNFLDESYGSIFGGFPHTPDEDGYLTLKMPSWGTEAERVPFVDIEQDYGPIVHGVFLDPTTHNRKLVQGVSDVKSFQEAVEAFTKITGRKARVEYTDEFDSMGIDELEGLKEMHRFFKETKGLYFNGVKAETETAQGLKAAASAATGSQESSGLIDVGTFFKKHFASKE